MAHRFAGWLLMSALVPGLAVAAGTTTEYTRELPADYRVSNERFNNTPLSLQGPRIAWAQPYALGKLRLLIILPWGAAHEAGELRSRLPADISLITTADWDKWINPNAGEAAYEPVPAEGTALTDTALRLLSPGYRYDAIIIGKVKWSAIPAEIRDKIITKVKGGTALVWISPWGVDEALRQEMALSEADNPLRRRVAATVPLGLLPLDVDFEQTGPKGYYPRRVGPLDLRAGKLGAGNVVWLDYQDRSIKPAHAEDARSAFSVTPWVYYSAYGGSSLTPYLAEDELHYDYYYSLLGQALYEATGKATAARVRAVQPSVSIARQKLPGAPVGFEVTLADPELRDWTVMYEVRDRRGRVVKRGPTAKEPATLTGSRYAPPLPRLRQGTYVVDVWALQRGAVLDWASAALTVTDTRYLAALEPAKEYFAAKEGIRGTVKFATAPAATLATSVELWDTYDRLVAVAPVGQDGAFAFAPVAHPLSRTYRLVAKVTDKGFTVDQAEEWVGLPNNTVDDYQFIMWAGGLNLRANRTALHQFKQHAVTGYYDNALYFPNREQIIETSDTLARNNLLANPYSLHAVLSVTPDAPYEKTVSGLLNHLQPRLEAYRRYGTYAYSTCEECYINRGEGAWDNPEGLKDYRAYLKERYGDIGKLNETWGSSFKDFGEIGLISFIEAKQLRQPTRWLEQELHRVERFNRMYERFYELIQQQDPGARMSLDCIEGMDFDWPRMARIATAGAQSPLESFRKGEDHLISTWIGYYLNNNDEWTMRITPWQYLFQGGTSMHWWPGNYALTGDLSEPMLCFQQAAEECRELQSGAGKLLIAAAKRVDPILMLWSNTSYYAGTMYPGEISWRDARQRFDNVLYHTGLDAQHVGADFIENDLAYGEKQRVLILPACQSISRQGAAKIKAFAEAGGLVIADFPPAVVDEYLRPYGAVQAAGPAEFETCKTCKGQKRIEVGHVWQACPACAGTGQTMKGNAAPKQSLLADVFDFSQQGAKKVGKGYGLYLKGSPTRREEWGALRKTLIEQGGVRGDVDVQDPLGNPRTDIRSYVFDSGRATFLGMLPDRALNNPPGAAVVVKLGRKCHVYDVRRHQYLGQTDTVRTGILPVEPKLLAFLPERLQGLNVSLSAAAAKPGDVLQLQGALLPASLKDCTLAVRVEVFRDGKPQEEYTKNLAFAGSFSHALPLALNQQPGTYRVRVTEVISGDTRELAFTVK